MTFARGRFRLLAVLLLLVAAIASLISFDSFGSLYDADYVGAQVCGDCHTKIFPEWQRSPHANMTRPASDGSVVGNFSNYEWRLDAGADQAAVSAARMYREGDRFVMALRHPHSNEFVAFPIERVVGYQYRQVYLTREPGGVLRRLPLQWSTQRQDYFSYWDFQVHATPTLAGLWNQMTPLNSAWNLFCARCHTTKLTVEHKDPGHTVATADWVDAGIACEACHGPGSQHVNYMSSNPVNRVAAYVNSKIRGQPVAFIANASKLSKGQAMSVCARCHGADIFRKTMDTYRLYEPGYSNEGRINDLSDHFREAPLEPRDGPPTMETWADGRPKGVGMLFRSLIESECYKNAEVRCFDCHDPHDNKQPAEPGLLTASAASNAYCLNCHQQLATDLPAHTKHAEGSEGSFCYDCHMPREIMVAATGVVHYARTHTLSSLPDPAASRRFGSDGSPNACNQCHQDKTPDWALERLADWAP